MIGAPAVRLQRFRAGGARTLPGRVARDRRYRMVTRRQRHYGDALYVWPIVPFRDDGSERLVVAKPVKPAVVQP